MRIANLTQRNNEYSVYENIFDDPIHLDFFESVEINEHTLSQGAIHGRGIAD